MSKPVLFVRFRPLERAENLRAIYEAYDGEKTEISIYDPRYRMEVASGKYDLMVIDEFPRISTKKCIMIWHAIQGGKCIGLDQKAPYYMPGMARHMTRIVTAGAGTTGIFSQCTGIPEENVLALGMPRTDQYAGKKKGDGGTVLAGKKAYLYAPTFREPNETPFPEIDWRWIDSQLTDYELLVIKAHPVTMSFHSGAYRHIMEVSGTEPSARYLYDCDVVITDYSSIMFDAYLLGKPVVLFEKRPGYTETRGMYMRYPEDYSSRYATNEEEMLRLVRDADGLGGTERRCLETVADMCDGHSCERICRLIHEMNEEET